MPIKNRSTKEPTKNYARVFNECWSSVLPLLTRAVGRQDGTRRRHSGLSELVVYFWMYRLTFGYGRTSALMSDGELSQLTGFSRNQVRQARLNIGSKGLILVTGRSGARYWVEVISPATVAIRFPPAREQRRIMAEIVQRSSPTEPDARESNPDNSTVQQPPNSTDDFSEPNIFTERQGNTTTAAACEDGSALHGPTQVEDVRLPRADDCEPAALAKIRDAISGVTGKRPSPGDTLPRRLIRFACELGGGVQSLAEFIKSFEGRAFTSNGVFLTLINQDYSEFLESQKSAPPPSARLPRPDCRDCEGSGFVVGLKDGVNMAVHCTCTARDSDEAAWRSAEIAKLVRTS